MAPRGLDLYAKCCVDPVNAARSITADMHAGVKHNFACGERSELVYLG